LRLRYTERHPDVIAQRQLVDTLKASGKTDPDSAPTSASPRNRSLPNPVYEQLKVRVVENDSAIASLQRQIADATREHDQLEATARGAPGLQAEYTNIDRDYDPSLTVSGPSRGQNRGRPPFSRCLRKNL
jgi:hypothetical protein